MVRNCKGVQQPMRTLVKAYIIWDRDHGLQNEGWYARLFADDRQQFDCPFDAPRNASDGRLIVRAREEARRCGLTIPENEKFAYEVRR